MAALALTRGLSVATRTGEYQTAIRLGFRGLQILEDVRSPGSVRVLLYHLLGSALWSVGELPQAKRLWQEGASLVDTEVDHQARPLFRAMIVRDLGIIAGSERKPAVEMARYHESLALLATYPDCDTTYSEHCTVVRRERVYTLIILARRQAPRDAEQSLQLALVLARRNQARDTENRVLQGLGEVALRRNFPGDAEKWFRGALATLPSSAHSARVIGIRAGLGTALLAQGRYGLAFADLGASVDALEAVRGQLETAHLRTGFSGNKQVIYRSAIQAAIGAGQPASGFELAERARARAFLDALGTKTQVSRSRSQESLQDEAAVRASLPRAALLSAEGPDLEAPAEAAAPRVRSATVAAYQKLVEEARRTDPEEASLLAVDPVRTAEIQDLLDADTNLVAYFVMPEETLAWVVSKTRLDLVRIPAGRSRLQSLVREVRQSIASRAPASTVNANLENAHRLLFEPVLPYVSSPHLLVVPHDVLHYLPFSALRSQRGTWLVDDYVISTLPSASVLRYFKTKGMASSVRALAVGNPINPTVPPLPFAEREARLIGERFPDTTLLLREEATKRAVLKAGPGASLIHFAAHAELRENDPMTSAILLTPEDGESGRLETRAILRLDLAAKLVILAACETGLGQLQTGDDLVGLQRAFLYAGAAAVMATLWNVDDRATYDLMRFFYDAWPAVGPAAALRDAQRRVRQFHPHPFAWASLTVTGLPR